MKKATTVLLLTGLMLVAGCGQQAGGPFKSGSAGYDFFKNIHAATGIAAFNPDQDVVLVSGTHFEVTSFDLLPDLYISMGRFRGNVADIPKEQLEQAMKQLATRKAENAMLVKRAVDAGLTVQDSVIALRMEQIISSRGTREHFVSYADSLGYTVKRIEDDQRNEMLVRQYIPTVVNQNAQFSDEELRKAYEADKTATVRHILFSTVNKSGEELEAVKKLAESVLEKAKAGEDFAELAKTYSEDPGSKDRGGIYEKFGRGQMVKPFNDASFELPIGSISDLVETQFGYHIIKVIERQKDTRPFDEAKNILQQELSRKNWDEQYRELLKQIKAEDQYAEHFDNL